MSGLKPYHVTLDWSQTDKEEVLVWAESREDAVARTKARWTNPDQGPKYVHCYYELRELKAPVDTGTTQ